jgi:hypothetical protein
MISYLKHWFAWTSWHSCQPEMIVSNLATLKASKCIILLFVHWHKVNSQREVMPSICTFCLQVVQYIWMRYGCRSRMPILRVAGWMQFRADAMWPLLYMKLGSDFIIFLKRPNACERYVYCSSECAFSFLLPNVLINFFVDWPYKTASHKLHQWSWCIQFLRSTIKNRNTWLAAGNIY